MEPDIENGVNTDSNTDLENPPGRVVSPLLRRIIVAVLLFALIEGLALLGIFNRLDLACYDYFFRIRGVQNPGQDVIIVALDDESLQRLGPAPLPRGMHARLLTQLRMASAVAFNMTFDTSLDERQDAAFGAAIKKHGKVVLPCMYTFSQAKGSSGKEKMNLPVLPLLRNAANVGFINIPSDEDTMVRRAALANVNFSPDVPVPSLGLAAVLTSLRDPLWKVQDHVLNVAGYKIYMDNKNQSLFNYWGPAGTIPTVSYLDVLTGQVYPECFSKKIVVVGYTDSQARDVFLTPFTYTGSAASRGGKMSGVEVQASIVQSLLNGGLYREMSPGVQAALLILVIMITVLLTTRRKTQQRAIITPLLFILALTTIYGLWLFGLVFYPVEPLLGVALAGLISQ